MPRGGDGPHGEPETTAALLPVHAGADARLLGEALAGLRLQTRPLDEIVVVLDGPVPDTHEAALSVCPGAVIVRLPENRGVAHALDAGLRAASSTWIVRADADDVSDPRRVELQLAALRTTHADVCGTAMMEEVGGHPVGVRRQPAEHRAIARRMRTQNPVNHPTATFRRSRALDVGGYQDLPHLEDYDLWARLLAHGATFVNLPAPLVRFRADGMLERRTMPAARAAERELQQRLVSYGIVGRPRAVANLVLRNGFRALPRPLLGLAYRVLYRREAER